MMFVYQFVKGIYTKMRIVKVAYKREIKGVAKSGWWATLKRWLFGEWIAVYLEGVCVAQVRTRRRTVEVTVQPGLAVLTAVPESTPIDVAL